MLDSDICFALSGSFMGIAVGLMYAPSSITFLAGAFIAVSIYTFGIGIRKAIKENK